MRQDLEKLRKLHTSVKELIMADEAACKAIDAELADVEGLVMVKVETVDEVEMIEETENYRVDERNVWESLAKFHMALHDMSNLKHSDAELDDVGQAEVKDVAMVKEFAMVKEVAVLKAFAVLIFVYIIQLGVPRLRC
jgi:hypothetical protein